MSAPTASLPPPAAALPPPSPAGAGPSPHLCPACAFHYRAAPSPAPSTFDGPFAGTATLAPDPQIPHCPVCSADIRARAVNVALGELGEAVWAAGQPAPAARHAAPANEPDCVCVACVAEAADVGGGEAEVATGHLKCIKCTKVFCSDHAELPTRRSTGHVMKARLGDYGRCEKHPDSPSHTFVLRTTLSSAPRVCRRAKSAYCWSRDGVRRGCGRVRRA